MYFISIKPVLSDHLPYVTIFHCSHQTIVHYLFNIINSSGGTSLVLSLYLDGKRMPIPVWTPKKKWHVLRYPLHQVLSVSIRSCVQILQ
jgi:hypothetical protein